MPHHAPGTALITGATSGIGAAFAERLARDGHDVILHGRREGRLSDAANRLAGSYNITADVLVADLADPIQVDTVVDRIRATDSLTVLVNNAGFTHLRPFIELSGDDIEGMIRVHVVALTRLSQAALPGMLERGRGDIINVSSDGTFASFPAPVMTVYAATKSYINTFTRGLHRIGSDRGLRVQALCTGYVRTEILDRHGITFEDWDIPDSVVMSAADQVSCSLAGLDLGEIICVPTLDDDTLLTRIQEVQTTIRDRSSGTGVPAPRYGIPPPDRR